MSDNDDPTLGFWQDPVAAIRGAEARAVERVRAEVHDERVRRLVTRARATEADHVARHGEETVRSAVEAFNEAARKDPDLLFEAFDKRDPIAHALSWAEKQRETEAAAAKRQDPGYRAQLEAEIAALKAPPAPPEAAPNRLAAKMFGAKALPDTPRAKKDGSSLLGKMFRDR